MKQYVRLVDGKYIVYNADTGEELGRFDSLDKARVDFPNAGPAPPAWRPEAPTAFAGDEGLAPVAAEAGESEVEKALRDQRERRVDQWNNTQRPEGYDKLTYAQAESAMGYMRPPLSLTFEESLNAMARYLQGEVPSAMEAQARATPVHILSPEEREHEIGRLRAAITGAPGAAPGVAGGLSAEALATPVGQAIAAVTDDPAVQAAMWTAAGLEGSQSGPWGSAPGGAHVGGDGEVGPWQIHPIHFENISAEDAADPAQAAAYMLPRFEDSVKSVPAELWESDPNAALALATANAERPLGWREGLTAEEALAIYGGSGRVGGAATGAGAPTPAGGIGAPLLPGAEDIKVTNADRKLNIREGLGLSDTDIKNAKLMGYPLVDWFKILQVADALEVSPGAVLQRMDDGEPIDTLVEEATAILRDEKLDKGGYGATPEERAANLARAEAAGLTEEEGALAIENEVSFEVMAAAKRQTEELRAANTPEEDIPSLLEAAAAGVEGLSAHDLAMRSAQERRALLLSPGRMRLTPEEVEQAEKKQREMALRGQPVGEGRAGIFEARQQIIRDAAVDAATNAAQLADALLNQGVPASEVGQRVTARFGPDAWRELQEVSSSKYIGHGIKFGARGSAFFRRTRSPTSESILQQRMSEAALRQTTAPGAVTREGPAAVARWEERQAQIAKRRPKVARRIGEEEEAREPTDQERLERGMEMARRKRKRAKTPSGFKLTA